MPGALAAVSCKSEWTLSCAVKEGHCRRLREVVAIKAPGWVGAAKSKCLFALPFVCLPNLSSHILSQPRL